MFRTSVLKTKQTTTDLAHRGFSTEDVRDCCLPVSVQLGSVTVTVSFAQLRKLTSACHLPKVQGLISCIQDLRPVCVNQISVCFRLSFPSV